VLLAELDAEPAAKVTKTGNVFHLIDFAAICAAHSRNLQAIRYSRQATAPCVLLRAVLALPRARVMSRVFVIE